MKDTHGLKTTTLAQEIAGEELSSEPEQVSESITGLESSALISQRHAFVEILSLQEKVPTTQKQLTWSF